MHVTALHCYLAELLSPCLVNQESVNHVFPVEPVYFARHTYHSVLTLLLSLEHAVCHP